MYVFCGIAAHGAFVYTLVIEDGKTCFDTRDVKMGVGLSRLIFEDNQRDIQMSRNTLYVGVVLRGQFVVL